MAIIKVLDKSIADKIAAGEVIERPISIVKELVENSLDSGAKAIVVEIKKGGKDYIRVTDDGCGIPQNQVETAFLRHATSKISKVSDLDSIQSLGFRGEALASISAVSHTELVTKCSDSLTGTKFIINGGTVICNQQTGCPDGSTFIITDLFFNTPVRRKFLKSDGSECALIIEYISQMALAYKNIKFRLINNGNIVFSTLGDGNQLRTISRVFSDIDTTKLVPVLWNGEDIQVAGYISTPALSKTTRGSQIFFVNGRVINSKIIEKGITLGYKERLFDGRFPVAYLFIDINPHEIDVNIHPNKREVRFDDESRIIEAVSQGIKAALSSSNGIVDATNIDLLVKKNVPFEFITNKNATKKDDISKEIREDKSKEEQIDIKTLLSTKQNTQTDTNHLENKSSAEVLPRVVAEEIKNFKISVPVSPVVNNRPFDIDSVKITGVLFNTYITATDESNLYLFDQHAAHERIFYEKLLSQYDLDEKTKQTLLVPLLINVSLKSKEDSNSWLSYLQNMGFSIEEFGPNTFRITEIPMFMDLSEAESFADVFIESIHDTTDFSNRVVIDKIIMASCKAAVKANQVLKDMEIQALFNELKKCNNPFSCPHGRPTFIKISKYDIEKMFKRV